ncbi:LuxR C-terminal-related transcriptional regulator [Kibdelosporangium lantanae]
MVVAGPAGAGKTTLLASWAAELAGVVWVTLDATDNDPAAFWSTLVRALAPGTPSPTNASQADFVDAVTAMGTPVHLVLDEADHLTDERVLLGLDTLARRLPDNLRLLLAARAVPPLHLSRLRLEGRLLEIGPAELAFTRSEAETLFHGLRLPLTAAEIDEVLRHTEGWPAGLRLAVLSLSEPATRAANLAVFPADDRAVVDYLTEEVLGSQPQHVRQFLRATSVCDEVCADLATALAGQGDSGEILDRLDRANALVTRTGEPGGWYRCHPVLRDVLRADLDRRHPVVRRRLDHIAAQWFRDADRPLTALRHAIAAAEAGLVDDLVDRFGLAEILRGRAEELHRLLGRLSPAALARPLTALVAAAAALDTYDLASADRYLSTVDKTGRSPGSGRLAALRAAVLLHRARMDGPATDTLTAAGQTGDDDLDTFTLLNRGAATLALGDHARAEEHLARARNLAGHGRRDHAVLLCDIQLAAVSGARGELSTMDKRAAGVIGSTGDRSPHHAVAYAMRGAYAYLQLDLDLATRFAALAKGLLPSHATLVLDALIHHGSCPSTGSAEVVRDRWRLLTRTWTAPQLIAYLAPTVQRVALDTGLSDWATEVVDHTGETLAESAEHALLQAVTHAHRTRPSQARDVLEPVLTGEARPTAVTTPIDAWLLEAVLLDRAGNHHRAHNAITKALTLAEPVPALLPFRTAGPAVRDMLVKAAGRFGKLDRFVSTALAVLPVQPDTPVDRLTSREHDLLLELPSMRTTEEIADSLYVSVNTVKTHLRGIYRKLGVNHRRDAVTVARERGLL